MSDGFIRPSPWGPPRRNYADIPQDDLPDPSELRAWIASAIERAHGLRTNAQVSAERHAELKGVADRAKSVTLDKSSPRAARVRAWDELRALEQDLETARVSLAQAELAADNLAEGIHRARRLLWYAEVARADERRAIVSALRTP